MLSYAQWAKMDTEDRDDLINHLKILCSRQLITKKEIHFIQDICLPVLTEADGEINDNMDFLNRVQSYGYMPADIGKTIAKHHQDLISWVNTKTAAQHLGCSVRTIRRLAKSGLPILEANITQRRWRINLVSVNDFLIRTKRA